VLLVVVNPRLFQDGGIGSTLYKCSIVGNTLIDKRKEVRVRGECVISGTE
jgi:hypothetical protein